MVGDRGWRPEVVMSDSGEKKEEDAAFKIDEEYRLEGKLLYLYIIDQSSGEL